MLQYFGSNMLFKPWNSLKSKLNATFDIAVSFLSFSLFNSHKWNVLRWGNRWGLRRGGRTGSRRTWEDKLARFATLGRRRTLRREEVEVHNCVNNNLFEIPFFALFSVEIVSKFKDRSVIHSSSESRRFFRFSFMR